MRKSKFCKCCHREQDYTIKCDTCEEVMGINSLLLNIIENYEENKYDFCSYPCLLKFITAELRKQPQGEKNEDKS